MYHPLQGCGCLGALPENEIRWAFPDGKLSTPLMGGNATTSYALLPAQQKLVVPQYKVLPRATAAQTGGVEFPFHIKSPQWSSNLWWWSGQGIVNIGVPRYSNDPDEYLRFAMVESDWDAVTNWLSWKIATILHHGGSTASVADKLALFPFGSYKYTGGTYAKKFYPFSMADYQSFFARFRKFETGADADKNCLDQAFNNYKQLFQTVIKTFNGSVPMQLSLTPCRAKLGWWHGIIMNVGLIAAFVGAAYAANLLAAGGASGGAAGGAAAGAAEAGAASAAASAGAAGAAELGTVAVTASALPTIPTAIGAGAALTGTAAGISAAQGASVNAPLETVEVTATRATPSILPELIGAAGSLGIPSVTSPTHVPAPNQTVQQPTHSDSVSTPGSGNVPPQGTSTWMSKFLDAAKKLALQWSGALLKQKLEEYLMRRLTPEEELLLEQIESQRPITAGISGADNSLLKAVLPWLIGGVVVVSLLPTQSKRYKRVGR